MTTSFLYVLGIAVCSLSGVTRRTYKDNEHMAGAREIIEKILPLHKKKTPQRSMWNNSFAINYVFRDVVMVIPQNYRH